MTGQTQARSQRVSSPPRVYQTQGPFDLALTAAPVAWGRGRWPNVDWIDSHLIWTGWEDGEVVARTVHQPPPGSNLHIQGSANPSSDLAWLDAVLGCWQTMPAIRDSSVQRLAQRMPGLRPFASGSLFEGVIASIVGQSISVAAAATVERRLALLTHDGLVIRDRRFVPFPRAEDLAGLSAAECRATGVTWRRAEAIVAIAQRAAAGDFPANIGQAAAFDAGLAEVRQALRALPLVGPWTAESALLWGLGLPDIYPSGDVALLRAAKGVYDRPGLTMKELDGIAKRWAPGRGWAARLLWTDLLGAAPCADEP